jgi:hypothetical protein
LAKDIRVIDNWGKEIHRVDDRQIRPETIDPGVVGGFGADKQIGVLELGQLVQNLHEIGGAELSGSTGGLDLLCEADCLLVF